MKTWIALFRGINVGGRNKLPMAELKADLSGLGYEGVATYIQSGNVVFSAKGAKRDKLAGDIRKAVLTNHGFEPAVMLLSADELNAAIAACPYPADAESGNLVHFFFLSAPAKKADRDRLDALATPSEAWTLTSGVFYLHAPDGFGRSKLAAGAESALGVPVTARNWRTVAKLAEIVLEREG